MIRNEERGGRAADVLAALALIACLAFLLWKAPYGYVSGDESFYLSVPYRLIQGDALMADEWNPSQLSGFMLYPAMRLYLALSGSTEGIYLVFRYIFAVAQTLAGAYIYVRMRRISPVPALVGALIFTLYAPLNIGALSYNSMTLMLLAAACVTLATTRGGRWDAVLAGLLFAGAVLGNPYVLALYALYCLAVLLMRLRKRDCAGMPDGCLAPGFWLFFTLGAALPAAMLLVFILSRCSLSAALAALPRIMNDPEHDSASLGYRLFKYAESLYGNAWRPEITGLWLLAATAMALDRGRTRRRLVYLIPALLSCALYYSYYLLRDLTINYLMYPLTLLGGFAYFLCREKDTRPFRYIYLPGLGCSLCMHFASNLALASIGTAMTVCCLAAYYYILRLAGELWRDAVAGGRVLRRLAALALGCVLLAQLGLIAALRSKNTFWDGDTGTLDCIIEQGPQRGVRTSERYYTHAKRLMDCTAPVRETEQEYTLYFSTDSWLYLMDDARMASYSGWVSYIRQEAIIARLAAYWELHPEKLPERLFLNDGMLDRESFVSALGIEDWTVTETAAGDILSRGEQ